MDTCHTYNAQDIPNAQEMADISSSSKYTNFTSQISPDRKCTSHMRDVQDMPSIHSFNRCVLHNVYCHRKWT